MPVGFQIALDLNLKGFSFLFKIWRKSASGQIATSSGSFYSKKCLTGGLSPMEILFCALLIQHPVMRKRLPGLVVDD
ncbi:hypothetical protein V6N12_066057 [Hibiscus sabdariffa]|uniref:Uncharacterized protein n=1 Tax=Hibiscus sabdariffa TaxID=183260 RepID=A0ABR2ASV2_9ROSI